MVKRTPRSLSRGLRSFRRRPLLGPFSALFADYLGHVRLALIHTARATTSSPALAFYARHTIAISFAASSQPTTVSASGEIHREPLEIGERAVVEGAFVRSPQDQGLSGILCVRP